MHIQFNTACLCLIVLVKNTNVPSALSSLLIILPISKTETLVFCLLQMKKKTTLRCKQMVYIFKVILMFFSQNIKHYFNITLSF